MSEEALKPIEEPQEQPEEQIEHEVSCSSATLCEPVKQDEIINEVKEESNNKTVEEKNEKEPESKTARLAEKKITCPKCSKTMNLRSYRYKHEKTCQGNLEDRPIKKQIKPKVKAVPIKPLPAQNEVIQEEHEPTYFKEVKQRVKQEPQQPVIMKTPYEQIMDNYNILHQEYLTKKKEKVNNLCLNMFSGNLRSKKR